MENKKTRKANRLLHLLWVIPTLIVLTFGVFMYLIPAIETVDRTAVSGSKDWMAKLDNSMPLSSVVLPGTHDSASTHAQLGYITQCQALTIGEQLDAGFRYLDIRLGANGTKLKLMHGFTNCTVNGWPWAETLSLDNVLSDCYAFLNAHPTETIVFAVKHEHGSETPEQFETMLNAYIDENPDAWLLSDRIPTVGEARGKIFLTRHYEDASQPVPTLGLPCYWKTQNGHDDVTIHAAEHKNGNYTLIVQDRYEYDAPDKLDAFRNGQNVAETDETHLSISFLSTKGSGTFGHPYSFAKKLNPALLAMNDRLTGWIAVDFGSPEIASHIYQMNFNK